MGFKLNKKNYKEVEYIINLYIFECKKNHKQYVEKGVYSIEIVFESDDIFSVFTFVDRIEIVEWNKGLKIYIYSNVDRKKICYSESNSFKEENSYYYRKDKEIYSNVVLGGTGGSTGDFSYVYDTIKFQEADDMHY